MKKLLVLLCILLMLASCGSEAGVPTVAQPSPPPEPVREDISVNAPEPSESSQESSESQQEETPDSVDTAIPTVYVREEDMTPQQIITAYFEQQYLSYINNVYINLDSIIDMDRLVNRNMMRWHRLLLRRRKFLLENDLCYVETEEFPYTIEFDDEPEDDRMDLWKKWMADTGESVVHFRIKGEEGKAYPPIMAMNSQHSMFFSETDGDWKIEMHYFPGSARKFARDSTIIVPKEADMLEQLKEEFTSGTPVSEPSIPQEATAYDAAGAVEYAMRYTENPNPAFYDIIDWVGNCANFVSQCVWGGFIGETEDGVWSGDYMTSEWYGGDGGSPAWENVNYFWNYITSAQELGGIQLAGVTQLQDGDIIQTRSLTMTGDENRFTHMLMVVGEETMMLSQNSPGCFVYYSDLANVETRLIRPTYVIG